MPRVAGALAVAGRLGAPGPVDEPGAAGRTPIRSRLNGPLAVTFSCTLPPLITVADWAIATLGALATPAPSEVATTVDVACWPSTRTPVTYFWITGGPCPVPVIVLAQAASTRAPSATAT